MINKKGQSTFEYAAMIVLILAAFLTMQNYAKRGIQGRWKQSVDQMGDQYDPRVADSNIRHTIVASTDTAIITTNIIGGFWTTRRDITNSTETKNGFTNVGAY